MAVGTIGWIVAALVCAAGGEEKNMDKPPIRVGAFQQETAAAFGIEQGLPDLDVRAVAVAGDDAVYAGTVKGLARFANDRWALVEGVPQQPRFPLCATDKGLLAICAGAVYAVDGAGVRQVAKIADVVAGDCATIAETTRGILLGTEKGAYAISQDGHCGPLTALNDLLREKTGVRMMASGRLIAVAADSGLYAADKEGPFQAVYPRAAHRSWAPCDVRAVVFDTKGRLWFASPQGVGCLDPEGTWTLYTAEDGLPDEDFTAMAAGEDGVVWFATPRGAIRFDGAHWAYRQGLRWLPDDNVRGIAVTKNGDAWFATPKGVGVIRRRPMRLAEKAKFYEDEIDQYHRRTPYGYVIEAALKTPGDKTTATLHDSDNDGLWTSMYGAGECFAYAATKSPEARKRAKAAFEALRFLQEVTQGGSNPAPKGFIARSILPTSGPNPNEKDYTRDKDLANKLTRDALWKVIAPRWPTSADGKWYWKCDTSSDETDGHYFFYAAYYDLVADTEEEKQRVRDVVVALTDHFLDHDFCLVDWDGQPTRWAVFSPNQLNKNPQWFAERGLNSLSMLSYLAVAEHMTGDTKYRDAFANLVNEHGYALNMMVPKMQNGPGAGNQSDDEMAFMSFYNLLKYSPNPIVRAMAGFAFHEYWVLEQPELNPFFNFVYAANSMGSLFKDQYMTFNLEPGGGWLEQSVETLMRFPLDRLDWRHTNSQRKDIVPLPSYRREGRDAQGKGHRRNGLVLPVDEVHFNHWNCDPWELDTGGNGQGLATGTVFLLPYYMGLYHGFIAEE